MDIVMTDVARAAFGGALEEVKRLRHDAVRAEHLLLAILAATVGSASKALDALSVDRNRVRGLIESELFPGDTAPHGGEYRYDESGAAVVKNALVSVGGVGTLRLSSARVLLAAVPDEDAPAWRILDRAGVDVPGLIGALRAKADEPE